MWHTSNIIHDISLRRLRRLYQLVVVLPPTCSSKSYWPKCLNTFGVLIYLVLLTYWRLDCRHNMVYQIDDTFSRAMDLIGFYTLVTMHMTVQLETSWQQALYESIFTKLEQLRKQFLHDLGIHIQLKRIQRYCNWIYFIFGVELLTITTVTIIINIAFSHGRVLFFAICSEIVLLFKLLEFSLLAAIILALHFELHAAGRGVCERLQRTRFESWSVRRVGLEQLSTLQDLHAVLWEVLREMENYFQLSMPGIMLKFFMDVSLNAYWAFLTIGIEYYELNSTYIFSVIVCKMLALFVSCWICTQCEKSHIKFRTLFHELAKDRRNPYLAVALQKISAQLWHEVTKFSPGGFVNINNNTLSQFIYTVITYIVIIIQFRMSE